MTKPQFAPEPSMEDILASIRKMISEDRPAARPLPSEPMSRTPFSETTSASAPAPAPRQGTNFGSLSEAIRAAGQPVDQRRSLEERISDLLENGGAAPGEALASLANRPRPAAPEPAAPSRTAEPASPAARRAQDLPAPSAGSLPFGTRAPAERSEPTNLSSPTRVAPAKAAPAMPEPKAEEQRVIAMPSRYPTPHASTAASTPSPSAPASSAAGSFGSRVAAAAAQQARATPTTAQEAPVARSEPPTAQPATPVEPAEADSEIDEPAPISAPSEALVDAMVELVKNEPSSLSVFTSGAAFMKGVSDKGIGVASSVAAHKKGESTLTAGPAAEADDGVPELDGAAAELLRPMLRQWLAENMPRIVEAALRSELTSGGKGPGKA